MNDDPPHQDWLDESNLDIDEAIGLPDPDPAFRKRLLARTSARIRPRRRIRQFARAAALLLAFTGGLATTHIIGSEPSGQSRTRLVADQPVGRAGLSSASSSTAMATEPVGPDIEPVSTTIRINGLLDSEALSLRISRATEAERIELLRETGDYFLERGEIPTAMNCYRQLLELQPAELFNTGTQESNWLLASMVSTRIKEKNHALSNG